MPWHIKEEDIERVKRETDLIALVQSRGIELKKHGTKDFIGLCPFHDDKNTPNFIVTPGKGLFHCMNCGKAGNAIQFVQMHDGISFRHAYELLNEGGKAAFTPAGQTSGPLKAGTIPRLVCPLDPEADDATLFAQAAAYYHQRLKEMPTARAYLASRGLDNDALIERFQIGFADRTLGLRLPDSNRQAGDRLRSRLTQLGLWRNSGHEHFNGCIVFPFHDEAGKIVSLYGRRTQPGKLTHLYAEGPHRGLFNRPAFERSEIILCEAVIDALTFYANGFENVTCLFGTEGFTDELWEALRRVQRVKLAYDADDAGERAVQRDAERFRAQGIEVFRVKFPHGMDANEYARKVKPADKSLALLLNGAVWLGAGARPPAKPEPEPSPPPPVPLLRSNTNEIAETAPALPAVSSNGDTPAPSSLVAASVSSLEPDAAKKENAVVASPANNGALEKLPVIPAAPVVAPPGDNGRAPAPCLQERGEAWFLDLEGREYRVAGLQKTLGTDSLKIALRLRLTGATGDDRFHLDQLDLSRDLERRRFIERAAEETGLTSDLLKRDLGKLLLAVEQAQIELARPQEKMACAITLTPEEREDAWAWLKAPNLIQRLREAFHQAGIIGEEINTLVAYLACVSRKLERPLAIIIQSASAAGKTTLMEAVLSFFPEEERVKYSAMTGQSLYYLGETNLKHKILAVVEEAGAEKASYALKLLQSEGELTIASTGKDPATGKMVTQEYHVEGPVMIFLTTTAIDMDEELQNRCLTLAVDESAEQTGRIHQWQRERRTLAGLIAREERKALLKKLRNAQRLLAPVLLHNPYAPDLTFAKERTRHRRDNEKYLTLIDSITLLHQYQREQGQHLINGRTVEILETTLDDIALANELAPEVLGRSLDELPPQTRRLLGCIRELLKRKADPKNGAKTGSGKLGAGSAMAGGAATFTRKELREACGWSLTQVRVHLERLIELEYLAIRHGRTGSQFVYELLVEVDATEKLAHIGLIDVQELRRPCNYESNLAGFGPGVAGQNGHLAGGGQTGPPPVFANVDGALVNTWRPDGITHQEGGAPAPHHNQSVVS
jgi:DNA primase catalytic core